MATYDAKRLRQMRKDGRLHKCRFTRSKPSATVETCVCGRFRHTEHAGPSIVAVEARIIRHHVDLDDGRRVSLFVNLDTNLVVMDVVDADPSDLGTEVYRRVV